MERTVRARKRGREGERLVARGRGERKKGEGAFAIDKEMKKKWEGKRERSSFFLFFCLAVAFKNLLSLLFPSPPLRPHVPGTNDRAALHEKGLGGPRVPGGKPDPLELGRFLLLAALALLLVLGRRSRG